MKVVYLNLNTSIEDGRSLESIHLRYIAVTWYLMNSARYFHIPVAFIIKHSYNNFIKMVL